MKKIKIQGEIHEIDCNNEMCGNCSYQPSAFSDQKCKLFDIIIEHINRPTNDGWKRASECINAEIKE